MQQVIQIKLECLTLCQEELAVTLSNQIRKDLEMYNWEKNCESWFMKALALLGMLSSKFNLIQQWRHLKKSGTVN